MDQIERVQYQAVLAVPGTWKGTSTDKIYEELGWETLYEKMVLQLIQNGITPESNTHAFSS